MADYATFKHGGVVYPLTADTTNSLLRDADPSLYHALEYLAAVLQIDIGPRLKAQAALEELKIERAVAQKLHVEPAPFLFADQLTFPTLAIYRKGETYADKTIAYVQDTSEWEFAYILPSLTPRQNAQLTPILRAAATSIRHAVEQGYHPDYHGGEKVWAAAGLSSVRVVGVRYGGYEPINEVSRHYRAIVGTMQVVEREMPLSGAFEGLAGVSGGVDIEEGDEAIPVAEIDASTEG